MVGTDPDATLVQRMADGDARALRALMDRHLAAIVAVADRMLANRAEAEDVAQDVFLRAWRNAGKWRGREQGGTATFRTWLYRVTINASTDRLRRRPNLALDEIAEPPDPGPSQEQALQQAKVSARVHAAIQALPERQRAALVLSHYEGLGNPAIGAALDISVEAVESLLARARRGLRAALTQEIGELLEGRE